MQHTTRYSDQDLKEFEALITQKLDKAKVDYNYLNNQVDELKASITEDGDIADDSFNNSELERLKMMQIREQKHLVDLENAMLRIKDKSFGICIVTGVLIDKRRLMVVPSTTKSLQAKID